MSEMFYADNIQKMKPIKKGADIVEITEGILSGVRADLSNKNVLSMPIAELASLGVGVSSLLPALNTVTQTMTINAQGLYHLVNAEAGDVLKTAKDGTHWGAIRTADGKSKLAKLQAVDSVSETTETVMPLNPAMLMMAVALFSIEKQLDNIEKTQEQILSFLETEKESEIEADVETLTSIINKYKLNWDNEQFMTGNHKMVLDIQRTARKNMNVYQKRVNEVLDSKQLVTARMNANAKLRDLQKKFKYYRLSLYTFSLASLLEIMLSGNFKEEYISKIKEEIEDISETYRSLFNQCSVYLENVNASAVDTNVMKGLGTASKAAGKLIGSIPFIREGQMDEFLQERGTRLKENAIKAGSKSIREFASVGNPGTGIFVNQMDKMIQIYNHTTQIFFDHEKIYLVAG